ARLRVRRPEDADPRAVHARVRAALATPARGARQRGVLAEAVASLVAAPRAPVAPAPAPAGVAP
ncbi:MAG: hypothetical protein R3263_13180, partial [Myxococcota bacterium]|nr:hypothetical protein [Myxococcota bacterium]